jgi:hypothetical protein
MPIKMSDLDRREDTRRKTLIYNSPAMQAHREERDHKPDASDAMRRKHAEERNEQSARLRKESLALNHRHTVEYDKHRSTNALVEPTGMIERHKSEREEINQRHGTERGRMAEKHRTESDRLPG